MGKCKRKPCEKYLKLKSTQARCLSDKMVDEFKNHVQRIIDSRESEPRQKIVWYRVGIYGNKLFKGLL